MKSVLQDIRILVITLFINYVNCQDGYSNQEYYRLQPQSSDRQESVTNFYNNVAQRDSNSQSVSSGNVQYHTTDEANKNGEYNRGDRGRTRTVFHIKNPLQYSEEDNLSQPENENHPQDSGTGSSNQYAAMQYSLPPEDFLRQMRAENQYYQQQQQLSTPSPMSGYTATPQPQYQYSTNLPYNYEVKNQQSDQINQLSSAQTYQYNGANTYSIDNGTPSTPPAYLSSSIPNSQYVSSPTNPYVSSSSPIYISSPPNLNQYVSSPLSAIPATSPDYTNNKVTTTYNTYSVNYGDQDLNKKLQIDHYDNSGNGIRYPSNVEQQYHNDYSSSTVFPTSTPYPNSVGTTRDSWQNGINAGSQYPFKDNQPNSRSVSNLDDRETHRMGNLPSANNVYLNYAPPDYQALNNFRNQIRDLEQDKSQSEYYSHGDYGWKLSERKPLINYDQYSAGNYGKNLGLGLGSDGRAVSQVSFHMDTGKPHNFEQNSKSSENSDSQEFVKAAAKAHENMKNQQFFGTNIPSNFNVNNPFPNSEYSNNLFGSEDKRYNKQYSDNFNSNSYTYGNAQSDLITASPHLYSNFKDTNTDIRNKLPFDHTNALRNIIPIDVSNVVPNSEAQLKSFVNFDGSKYNVLNYGKEQTDLNLNSFKSLTDAYYKDKNAGYGFNIKTKPEESSIQESMKQSESNYPQYAKQQLYESAQNSNSENKRFADTISAQQNFASQPPNNYQDNIQQQPQRIQNPLPSNIANILKLNDIPNRLAQGFNSDNHRLQNNYDGNNIPTPIPGRLNQNVESHQIDVASILNNLAKQPSLPSNRPDVDTQISGSLPTVNGFRIANPFNVDLKLVAEMFKGRSVIDENQMLRDQFSIPTPLKLDISQLQQLLLRNDNYNYGNYPTLSDTLSALANPYKDIYSNGRFPYQGVKYSRSQEEEESILPIADSSNNHPIGAVIEDPTIEHDSNIGTDLTAAGEENILNSMIDERPKKSYGLDHRVTVNRLRHPNSLNPSRNLNQRRTPKSKIEEPYPLLKPPPTHTSRSRNRNKIDRHGRKPKVYKRKGVHILRTEPLFESETLMEDDEPVPRSLRSSLQTADEKSDTVDDENSS